MDQKQHRLMIFSTEDRRDPCVYGQGRRISCTFPRMLMPLMVPSRGRNDAGSRPVRLVVSEMRPERLRPSTPETNPYGSPYCRMRTAGIGRCNSARRYAATMRGHNPFPVPQNISCSVAPRMG
jgi:hypothetical protein